jgi:hypothetical protein
MGRRCSRSKLSTSSTQNPRTKTQILKPSTLNPQPSTQNPKPYSLFPIPYSLFPIPKTLYPIPKTLTLNQNPSTPDPKPRTLHSQTESPGHRITAVGCSLSAIVAAFLAVSGGMHLEASVAACACVSVCGEGFPSGKGPAELRTFWIDGLYSLTPERLEEMANVSCEVVANPPSPAISEPHDILDIPKVLHRFERIIPKP